MHGTRSTLQILTTANERLLRDLCHRRIGLRKPSQNLQQPERSKPTTVATKILPCIMIGGSCLEKDCGSFFCELEKRLHVQIAAKNRLQGVLTVCHE